MKKENFLEINRDFSQLSPEEVLSWALSKFDKERLAFSSSMGAEDQVITHMLKTMGLSISIFTIDTGRLYPETYDLIKRTEQKYGFRYDILEPEQTKVNGMVSEHGENLFYESLELRKMCCHVRKLEPLRKKMFTLDAWICGLRKEQSVTRAEIGKIEWDETFGVVKINPLTDWTEDQVWSYIRKNNIPYHALHDSGYPSIGCAPCTRAIQPGEDVRAGRWWWENPQNRECGLHRGPKKKGNLQ